MLCSEYCTVWLRDLDTQIIGAEVESFEMWCWRRIEKIKMTSS